MSPRERVEAALVAAGVASPIIEFEASTRTAPEAAAAVGCELGQIVKSLFFLAGARPTLVLVAGDRQADTSALARLLGVTRKRLKMGTADEVLEMTGYPVGGVSPFGSVTRADVVVDESLRRFERLWAAAGAGNAVFEIGTLELAEKADGQWAAITRDRS